MPVVGFLHASMPEPYALQLEAFRGGLNEQGYVEGRNVTIEYRWANNDAKRFPELALAQAVKAATSTIPLVFSMGTDAVKAGLIQSYNRPGGNATGVTAMTTELGAKRLELLLEIQPRIKVLGLLVNPGNPFATEAALRDVRSATAARGLELVVLRASNPREIDAAFASVAQQPVQGIVVNADPLFNTRRNQLSTLAARHAIPMVGPLREFPQAGVLMSYGPDDAARHRLVGVYTGRILKGEKPADMPVQQPTAFQLVINLQTARALGITVPPTLLARADEVIE
jgi:putative ABC transport system substrate-binding protein